MVEPPKEIRAIAQAVVLLASANKVDPLTIFGKTIEMNQLAEAFSTHEYCEYRDAAKTIQTWNEFPPKTQKLYLDLFRLWSQR